MESRASGSICKWSASIVGAEYRKELKSMLKTHFLPQTLSLSYMCGTISRFVFDVSANAPGCFQQTSFCCVITCASFTVIMTLRRCSSPWE